MKLNRIIAIVAVAAITVGALAQGAGGAGGNGGGGGGRRAGGGRGQRMMMGGGMMGGPESLLLQGGFGGGGNRGGGGGGGGAARPNPMRDAVIEDIKLTDDQKTKIDEIRTKQSTKMREAFQSSGGGNGGPPDMAAIQKTMAPIVEESNKAFNEVLTAEQKTRLRQIWLQTSGNRALSNKDVQKDLTITDEQKAKIEKLNKDAQDANMALFQNQDLEMQDRMQRVQNNNKALDAELGKVLTETQKAKMKELSGKEFKRPEGGGGRRG